MHFLAHGSTKGQGSFWQPLPRAIGRTAKLCQADAYAALSKALQAVKQLEVTAAPLQFPSVSALA